MKLKLTIMLDDAGIIQSCEYIKKSRNLEEHNYDKIHDYDYEFNCPQSVIQAASSSGASDLDGLFKLLKIDKDKKVMFVIVNKKITFFNSEVKEGDHIELLPAIDGG